MPVENLPYYAELIQPLTITTNYGFIRLEMYSGVAKQRRNHRDPIYTATVVLLIRGNENRNKFEEWFKNAIQGGVGRFNFYDPIRDKSFLARFTNGNLSWSCSGYPAYHWTVTVNIELF